MKKSIFDSIKEQLEKKSSGGGGKKFFLKSGDEKRIRFITDLEDALVVKFHQSEYGAKTQIKHPCLAYYGKKCPNCSNKAIQEHTYYIWQVYSYDMGEKQFMVEKANSCSPVPHMSKIYERKGTITDRDYIISQTGEGTKKTFMFDPGEPKPFKKKGVEPWTEEEIFEIMKQDQYLFMLGDVEADDDEDEAPTPKKKKKVVEEDDEEEVKPKKKKKVVVEEDYDDEDDDD